MNDFRAKGMREREKIKKIWGNKRGRQNEISRWVVGGGRGKQEVEDEEMEWMKGGSRCGYKRTKGNTEGLRQL